MQTEMADNTLRSKVYSFTTEGGGAVRFDLDFSDRDRIFASFLDDAQQDAPFHLSFRQKDGLVVANARINRIWGAEQHAPAALGEGHGKIEVRFTEDALSVMLDGTQVFSFGEEFPGLERIRHIRLSEGVLPGSLQLSGEGNAARRGEGRLVLEGFLALRGWAVDPGLDLQQITLTTDKGAMLQTRPVSRPDIATRFGLSQEDLGIRADLPGWIWEDAGETLALQLHSNGIPCGTPLELTRAEVVQQIADHMPGLDIRADGADALLAIEHVRFAGLSGDLPDPARAVLDAAAGLYGVQDYMAADQPGTSALPQVTIPAPGPQQLLLAELRNEFGRTLQTTGTGRLIDSLASLLEARPLEDETCRYLLLSLTETFCAADQFADLHAYARDREMQFAPSGEAWHDSTILPYLYMDGRLKETAQLMSALAENRKGWVVTTPLGWIVRSVLSADVLATDPARAETILRAFMTFVSRRAGSYWDRTPCLALIDATITILGARATLPEGRQRDITAFALRCYGLSRAFWQRYDTVLLPREKSAIGDPLAAGRGMFAVIEDWQGAERAELNRALAFFRAWNNPETERVRREITLSGSEPARLVAEAVEDGRGPGEMLLRQFARPGAPLAGDPEIARLVRSVIRTRYEDMPKSPFHDLQIEISERCKALLDDLEAGRLWDRDTVAQRMRKILHRMSPLLSERAGHLGLALVIRMANALLRMGRDQLVRQLVSHLEGHMAGLSGPQKATVLTSPAVRSALWSLLAPAVAARPPAIALRALFSGVLPQSEPELALWPGKLHPTLKPVTAISDTLVMIFSCRRFLEDRVGAIRSSWLPRLAEFGIPHVIVVGDGDGTLADDVLQLDVPDDYEGLPQKTLAAIRWAHDHTPASYMLKIDDDCLLDPQAFFGTLSHLKADYQGRVIEREIGGTDRTWHILKSATTRGTRELDRSPEPSTYCDGGSGYVLSRTAMAATLAAAESREGRKLIGRSFMEDKLVGDLLALADIRPTGEDHVVAVQRRTSPGGVPVSRWRNGFYPGPMSPTKIVHLDTETRQKEVFDGASRPELRPRKLWPSHAPAKLGSDTNLLELVSDEAALARLNAADLAVVSCVRNEMLMLPHFLAHYRKLGVTCFLMIDNCSDDGTLEYLLEQPDVAVFSADTPYGLSHYGVAWQMALITNLRPGRWTLVADADEFLLYPGHERRSLSETLKDPAWAAADAVRILMLDMYPEGPLEAATFASGDPFAEAPCVDREPILRVSTGSGPFSNDRTVTSALRHRLMPGSRPELFVAQKIALMRYQPWMRPSPGLHYLADHKPAGREMLFAHFKYNAGFRQKAIEETGRGQHFNNAEEYRKYLALMAEGRDRLFDPEVSVRWDSCDEVRRILAAEQEEERSKEPSAEE